MTQEEGIVSHLEELRRRLIISLIGLSAASVLSFLISDWLLAVVTRPIHLSLETLYFTSPYEAFMTRLKVSVMSGLVLSSPLLFAELWLFVSPGLYLKEKRVVLPLVLISAGLFLAGVLFAYFVVVPFALQFFLGFQTYSIVPLISIGSYISFFLSLVLIFGLTFDLPVVLVGLIYVGALGSAFLAERRRIIVVIIFVLAALLTPADAFSQIALALPLWVLFEVSIWIGRRIERRRNAEKRT